MDDLTRKVSAAIMEARSSFFAEAARREGYTYCDWLAKAAIDAARHQGQDEAKAASVDAGDVREVLLFCSYCDTGDNDCTDARPCYDCLVMSNVFLVKSEAIDPRNYRRELGGQPPHQDARERIADVSDEAVEAEARRLRCLAWKPRPDSDWDEPGKVHDDNKEEWRRIARERLTAPLLQPPQEA